MVQKILKKMKWLGHDGFMVKAGGMVIVIDPFKIADCEPADIILISHSHYDHCSPEDIEKIRKPDSVIVTEAETAGTLSGDVHVLKPGENLTIDGIQIEAVAAYNTNKHFHPKEKGWLGFIITVDGVRIYHAGDTDLIPEMKEMQVDIALLPVSGTYVMTATEAIEAAKQIRPKVAVPMHYDTIVGTAEDAEAFKTALDGICEVAVFSK